MSNTLNQAILNQLKRDLFKEDLSRQHIVDISQKTSSQAVGQSAITIEDPEVINLLNWLAEEQGITPILALKKAIVNTAYLYDATTKRGGKLLVKRQDNAVGEIRLN